MKDFTTQHSIDHYLPSSVWKKLTYEELKTVPRKNWGYLFSRNHLIVYTLNPLDVFKPELAIDPEFYTIERMAKNEHAPNCILIKDVTRIDRRVGTFQKFKLIGKYESKDAKEGLEQMLDELAHSRASSYLSALRLVTRFLGDDCQVGRYGGLTGEAARFIHEHTMLWAVQQILGENTDITWANYLSTFPPTGSKRVFDIDVFYSVLLRRIIDLPYYNAVRPKKAPAIMYEPSNYYDHLFKDKKASVSLLKVFEYWSRNTAGLSSTDEYSSIYDGAERAYRHSKNHYQHDCPIFDMGEIDLFRRNFTDSSINTGSYANLINIFQNLFISSKKITPDSNRFLTRLDSHYLKKRARGMNEMFIEHGFFMLMFKRGNSVYISLIKDTGFTRDGKIAHVKDANGDLETLANQFSPAFLRNETEIYY